MGGGGELVREKTNKRGRATTWIHLHCTDTRITCMPGHEHEPAHEHGQTPKYTVNVEVNVTEVLERHTQPFLTHVPAVHYACKFSPLQSDGVLLCLSIFCYRTSIITLCPVVFKDSPVSCSLVPRAVDLDLLDGLN